MIDSCHRPVAGQRQEKDQRVLSLSCTAGLDAKVKIWGCHVGGRSPGHQRNSTKWWNTHHSVMLNDHVYIYLLWTPLCRQNEHPGTFLGGCEGLIWIILDSLEKFVEALWTPAGGALYYTFYNISDPLQSVDLNCGTDIIHKIRRKSWQFEHNSSR